MNHLPTGSATSALTVCLFAWLTAWLFAASAAEPAQATSPPAAKAETEPQTMSFWMAKKLDHSQGILRSLAEADFAAIAEHARQLERLNQVEGFVRRRNPEYTAHVQHFARISKELGQQAKQENIEGTTLAFNQLTVSCVRCHQTLRQHEPPQDLSLPAAPRK